MDARLLGMAIPHASVGSFVRRSHAPFAITASVCSRLELTVYYSGTLHCYLSVVVTLSHLTNRWSQPLAVVMSTFNSMKQFPMFAALAPASGGSAPSR
jgi:hypothetical protein